MLEENLNKIIKTEPSGRFPWFPREDNWEDSWLNILKIQKNGKIIKKGCNHE
jgi:hypothetical protein